jgi:hypothetical protein
LVSLIIVDQRFNNLLQATLDNFIELVVGDYILEAKDYMVK